MTRTFDRRSILRSALGLAGLALAPLPAWSAGPTRATSVRLNERLALIQGVGANVLALRGAEGLLLVDSGAPGHDAALTQALRALDAGARVHTLFNTHWHRAQTGGNEAFGRAGARIVAHEKTRLRLATGYYIGPEDRYEPALPEPARPSESFYTEGSLRVADERIDYGHLLQAHTDGDIYVFFRDSNVLAVGDAAAPAGDPELDWFGGGWLGGRIDALARLLELADEHTRIVAAQGPVIGRAELQREHDVLSRVFDRMVELIRQGYSTDAMVEAGVTEGHALTWQDPHKFVYDAHKGFWAHHNTLSHDIV